MVVSVVLRKSSADVYGGKEYHYVTDLDVKPGDIVIAPTTGGLNYGKIQRVNVDESELPAWLKGKLREIVDFAPAPTETREEIEALFE